MNAYKFFQLNLSFKNEEIKHQGKYHHQFRNWWEDREQIIQRLEDLTGCFFRKRNREKTLTDLLRKWATAHMNQTSQSRNEE